MNTTIKWMIGWTLLPTIVGTPKGLQLLGEAISDQITKAQ